jgi:hypothetical protein
MLLNGDFTSCTVALADPIHLDRMTCRALPAGPEHAHCHSLAWFGAVKVSLCYVSIQVPTLEAR